MNARHWRSLLAVLVLTSSPSFLTQLEASHGRGQSDKPKNEKKADKKGHESIEVIAVASAGISVSYGDARAIALDNHLTGHKPLPPGIRKNLARGKPMPPGIAKTRLPSSFLNRLPAHDGYEWSIAGTDLVLVFKADLSISGVLRDVFN